MDLQTFGGRRFLLTVGCSAVTSVLCWYGKIGDAVYATVIIGTVGTYIGSNTFQKLKASNETP